MATESDLRDLLRGPEPEGRREIDLDAVLTRARRRRRPRVLAAQALGGVAVVGAIVTGVAVALPPAQTALLVAEDAGGSADESAQAGAAGSDAPHSDLRWAMDACGEPPVAGTSDTWALATAVGGSGDDLTATLTLRNAGDAGVAGDLVPWALTFVRDGVVVGRAAFPDGGPGAFALGAGESLDTTLAAVVEPCDPARPLAPGSYQVRGVVEITAVAADGRNEVVYGALAPVELR